MHTSILNVLFMVLLDFEPNYIIDLRFRILAQPLQNLDNPNRVKWRAISVSTEFPRHSRTNLPHAESLQNTTEAGNPRGRPEEEKSNRFLSPAIYNNSTLSNSQEPLALQHNTSVGVYPPQGINDNGTVSESELKDLWILGLFPRNGSWPGGRGQLPAIEMGLRDVNNDPTMLPGYRLRMTVNDTQCHSGIGVNAMYEQLYRRPAKLMILGAGCSTVSQATAQASHLWGLVQLSYSSASPALSDKSVYPRFYRVFPPESSYNPAKLALLRAFSWRRVGLLHQSIELFSMTNEEFMRRSPSHNVDILTSESFVSDPAQAISNLKKSGARIIIGNFYEDKARMVFCEAQRQGLYGSRYVWIITGFYSEQWWRVRDVECSIQQMEQAVRGYFTADALPKSLSNNPGTANKTSSDFLDEYRRITNDEKLTGHQEAPYGYDSVWAIAMVLNTSRNIMASQGWGRGLEDFDYSDREMLDLFWSVINTTSFEGVSGPVMFDENGDRRGVTQIEQLQGDFEVRVGVYVPSNNLSSDIQWEPDMPVLWRGGRPPSDRITEKVVPREISLGVFITMTSLASLGLVLSCFLLAFNIRHRHKRYIRMSSPNMNNLILAGSMLAFLAIAFGGADSVMTNTQVQLTMCKFFNWTLALSFSLAFGALFSKTWRVHKIFTNKKIQRMVIKDYQLVGLVCVLVGMDVLILTAWEFVDPLRMRYFNDTYAQIPDPHNDNQLLVPQTRHCESPRLWYFAGVLCVIKGLLLLFGAFLAFETRKVTVPALNDSKFIGMSVYNISLLCGVGLPVSLLLKDDLDARYVLLSLFIFFATFLTLCLVFIPKIKNRNSEPHTSKMFHKSAFSNDKHVNSKGQTIYMFTDDEIANIQRENGSLKSALTSCQKRLADFEAQVGLCLPDLDALEPTQHTENSPLTPRLHTLPSLPESDIADMRDSEVDISLATLAERCVDTDEAASLGSNEAGSRL